jgi:hypothetical protein
MDNRKIKVKVQDWVDRFYLPDVAGHFVKGGAVVELDVIEAEMQIQANNVRPLDELEAKYLEAKTEGDNKELAQKDLIIQNLKKELSEVKKKKDLEAENVELKVELSKAKKDTNVKK